jgi:hypothetical protein
LVATAIVGAWLLGGPGSGVARAQGLVINEFMAANANTITNKLGMTSDWLEIYNGTGAATNLLGMHLTDDAASLAKWTFPSTNIGAGKYLLVYASDSNGVYLGELHCGFKLSKNAGSYLALVNTGMVVVSSYSNYPAQETDVSFGIATNVAGGSGISRGQPRARPTATAWLRSWRIPGSAWTAGCSRPISRWPSPR